MFRDILTNKWFIGGFCFLIVFALACVFWYRYDTAADRKALAETAELIRQLAKKAASDDKMEQATDAPAENTLTETTGAVVETDTRTDNEAKTYRVGDIYVGKTPPSLPVSQDELVSPYGFGLYPELPEGYGPITWPRKHANSELMIRAEIKLLNQGVPVEGIAMKNGMVYPIIKGICYVKWGETSYGRRYIRRSTGHPDDGDYMEAIEEERRKRRESVTASDFPGIQLILYEEGGIDPYTFLDLPK
jgi:hypothetical protein